LHKLIKTGNFELYDNYNITRTHELFNTSCSTNYFIKHYMVCNVVEHVTIEDPMVKSVNLYFKTSTYFRNISLHYYGV